ncbi:hypothetical protein PI124_g24284, partial [Phytophthora idaei]
MKVAKGLVLAAVLCAAKVNAINFSEASLASGSTGTVSGADQTQQQSPTESSAGGSPATSTEASAGS